MGIISGEDIGGGFLKGSRAVIKRLNDSLIILDGKGRDDQHIFVEGIYAGMIVAPVVEGEFHGIGAHIIVFIDLAGGFADNFDMTGEILSFIDKTAGKSIVSRRNHNGFCGILIGTVVKDFKISHRLAAVIIDKLAVVNGKGKAFHEFAGDGNILFNHLHTERDELFLAENNIIGALLNRKFLAGGIGSPERRNSMTFRRSDVEISIVIFRYLHGKHFLFCTEGSGTAGNGADGDSMRNRA